MPTLSNLIPENVAHGTEIQLQVLSGGSYVSIAELSEVDYDDDEKMEGLPILGQRIQGYRRGQFIVKGTIKGYWLNGALRAMYLGTANPTSAGMSTVGYESTRAFNRYQIQAVPTSVYGGTIAPPLITLVNVVLNTDAVKWTANKYTEETVTFFAEDVYGQ